MNVACVATGEPLGAPGAVWNTRCPEKGSWDDDDGEFKTASAPPSDWDGRGVWGPHIVNRIPEMKGCRVLGSGTR